MVKGYELEKDRFVVVGRAGEKRLELRRRQVDALLEQVPEKRAVALGVARLRVVEVADGSLRHEEGEERADPLHAAERGEPLLEERGPPLELVVDAAVAQPAQHREAGGGRERVPGKRPCLIDRPRRREQIHDLRPAAEGRKRQPAADDLPQHGEIGEHAVPLLRAAACDAEAGDHLVEDEQRARHVAEPAQHLEVAGLRRDDAHVRRDRLHDDRGEPLAVAEHGIGGRIGVVVGDDDRVRGGARRHAGRGGDPERCEAGAGACEQGVRMAVVAAGRLEDPVLLRERAREPQCAHRRLRPRGDEPHLLHRRHGVGDLGGELDLRLGGGAEARPAQRGVADCLHRLRVGVAEEERPPGHDPVEEPAAVLGLDVGALRAADEERLVEADGSHGADRRVDAAGDQLERAPVQLRARSYSHAGRSRVQ